MTNPTGNLPDLTAMGHWLIDAAYGLLPFGTTSRLHWTGLSAFLIIGLGVYLFNRSALREEGYRGFGHFLLPLELYRRQTSAVDLKVYLANKVFGPVFKILNGGVQLTMVIMTANLVGQFVRPGTEGDLPLAMLFVAAFAATLATDLAYYAVHRAHHEHPLLWPFHKLHHSAEVLTPMTAFRNHPIFNLLLGLTSALFVGPVVGVVFGLFGLYDSATLFGLGVLFALFNLAGGAFRHSHVWVDYGPVLDRVFMSPAQHQIHHSMAPRHHDKNYGLIFSLWDWMFGTLYVPGPREKLEFGVADAHGNPLPQVHRTLVQAYIVPFREFGAAWTRRRQSAESVEAKEATA